MRRRERLRDEVRTIVAEQLLVDAAARARGPEFEALLDSVVAGDRNPYEAADALLEGRG